MGLLSQWVDRHGVRVRLRVHRAVLHGLQVPAGARHRGTAVQVDPMKAVLKAPGTERLKL